MDDDCLTGPLACCSVLRVQPRRPSTAKTTQHPDPSIDPQVDSSHPSPHPSFPLCSSDLMSRSKYWSASGPSLLRSPSPPPLLPHGFNYNISKTSLLYRLSLICFWHLRTLSKNRTNERTAASLFPQCPCRGKLFVYCCCRCSCFHLRGEPVSNYFFLWYVVLLLLIDVNNGCL